MRSIIVVTMLPVQNRTLAVVVLLLCGAAVIGVVSEESSDQPDPEALVADAATELESASVEGVRTDRVADREGSARTTIAIAEDPPDQLRVELLDHEDAQQNTTKSSDRPATVRVHNQTDAWRYYESQNEVVTSSLEGGYFLSNTARFGIVNADRIDQYEFTYRGTTSVADRQTHVVEIEPSESFYAELSVDLGAGEGGYSRSIATVGDEEWHVAEETWWIDDDTGYPVKQELRLLDEDDDEVAVQTRTYEELTVNASIDAEQFTFEPPDDAEVFDRGGRETELIDDFEAGAAEIGLERDTISVPNEWELTQTAVSGTDTPSLALAYANGDGQHISLTIMPDPPSGFGTEEAEREVESRQVIETDVGSVNGTVVSYHDRPALVWTCGDNAYQLWGDQDVNVLVTFADEIQCG